MTAAAPLDLSSRESIVPSRAWIVSQFGRLDILFNKAVARAGGDLQTTSEAEWGSTMKIDSTGLLLSCQIYGEQMALKRSGVIINVASIYGVVGPDFHIYEGAGFTNAANYAFAKGAWSILRGT